MSQNASLATADAVAAPCIFLSKHPIVGMFEFLIQFYSRFHQARESMLRQTPCLLSRELESNKKSRTTTEKKLL
jgi:hypothetical protein